MTIERMYFENRAMTNAREKNDSLVSHRIIKGSNSYKIYRRNNTVNSPLAFRFRANGNLCNQVGGGYFTYRGSRVFTFTQCAKIVERTGTQSGQIE